ncbi:ABC transporter permease [candidate division KSB1 bacterium]
MKKEKHLLSNFQFKLLNKLAGRNHYTLVGDLEELYCEIAKSKGKFFAVLWYWYQVLRSLPRFFVESVFWRSVMFKNYFKIAYRNMGRQKIFSFINIAGLAIGMAGCVLMFLWIHYEMSFDRFHKNFNSIYRVISETHASGQTITNARTPNPLGPYLVENFPEIKNFMRYQSFDGWMVKGNEKVFTNDIIGVADNSIFEMFTFPFVKGDPKTALADRNSIIISEKMAKKYFGDNDPMGKVININSDFIVTGVFKNIPETSHIYFDCMFPLVNMERFWSDDFQNWRRIMYYTYVRLEKDASVEEVDRKISGIVKENFPNSNIGIFLQPLKKVHLYSNYGWDLDNYNKGNINIIYYISLTAFFILLIACINFINLSTARSSLRAKEVGMRKVTGACRKDIISQFMGESLLISVIALIAAVIIVIIIFPAFNQIAGRDFTAGNLGNIGIIIGLFLIALFTGILSGSYPAFYLSSFRPVKVLKNTVGIFSQKGILLRRILVIMQFTITIVLIVGSTVFYNQLEYIRNTDLGFDRKNILIFPNVGGFHGGQQAAVNELYENPNILSVSLSVQPGSELRGVAGIEWEGKNTDDEVILYPISVDHKYLETFNIRLLEGEFFSTNPENNRSKFLINEAAAAAMGMESPVGKRLSYTVQQGKIEGRIIGVIKNFHQSTLRNQIEPMIFMTTDEFWQTCIKYRPGKTEEVLAFLEEKWSKFVADRDFQYTFLDDAIDKLYSIEDKIGMISRYFTFLAVVIACMGLYGLASFITEKRTKEVGIRKVLGAPISKIIGLLSKEFLVLITVSSVIAFPVSYYLMNKLLGLYAYRTGIGIGTFLLTILLTMMITFVTVAYRTYKAASADPVDSLRYE